MTSQTKTSDVPSFTETTPAGANGSQLIEKSHPDPERVPRIVTTSWDDGDLSDLKLAELLNSRGLRGTFYVPINPYRGRPALDHANLRFLSSAGFEIGAHGVSHQYL